MFFVAVVAAGSPRSPHSSRPHPVMTCRSSFVDTCLIYCGCDSRQSITCQPLPSTLPSLHNPLNHFIPYLLHPLHNPLQPPVPSPPPSNFALSLTPPQTPTSSATTRAASPASPSTTSSKSTPSAPAAATAKLRGGKRSSALRMRRWAIWGSRRIRSSCSRRGWRGERGGRAW